MLDLISLGDATLDTFIEIDEATVNCNIHQEECQLCMSFADKIPIRKLQQKVAGNAANVAIGASRLGLKTALATILGQDDFAGKVIQKMRAEKVSVRYVRKQRGTLSNFAVVLNFQGERTQLIHRVPRDYKLPHMAPAKYVYLTAMGENHHQLYDELLDYLSRTGAMLAYNPGREQIVCQERLCRKVIEAADILFVNKDEANLILKGRPPKVHKGMEKMRKPQIRELLLGLHELGPTIVVMTDGPNGSYVYANKKIYEMPIFQGPLVERTGAGDSYATGFLSATIQGRDVEEAMAWGTYNAWSVVQFVGPIDGLLKLPRMNGMVGRHPFFRGEEI